MRIPREVKVGDAVYRVRFVRQIPRGPEYIGYCCAESQTIYIKTKLSKADRLSTYVHELLHALDFEHEKLNLPHAVIYRLERPLAQFLRDNLAS